MSVIERLLKQETWFKWMQFQNKAIIHHTAIMDCLFIYIVQFIFDVYHKIRLYGLDHSINNSLRVLNDLMSACSKYSRQIKEPTIRVTKWSSCPKAKGISRAHRHEGKNIPVHLFPFTGLRDPSSSTHAHKSTSIFKTPRQVAWAFGHM